jgi:4-carboxymuconolactone decarboxylase
MSRITVCTPKDVPASEQSAYDAFVQRRGKFPDHGPYTLLLHMPDVAQKFETLRLTLRDEASVPQKIQELVMITVAREMDCPYIWFAHAASAREIGVRGDVIDAIREKRPVTDLGADEQVAADFTRELLRSRKVGQATFDRATKIFGRRGTMTLTTLIASYANLAYFMNAYEMDVPPHATEKPLPV